jgi:hypothetical protein
MESYDHSGNVIRVHPKSINGQPVSAQHYPPTSAELEIMYSQADLAMELERTLVRGFDVAWVSNVAFEIYQDHGLELTAFVDRALLILMTMEGGEEFELTESEFLALISEIKAM